MVNRVCGAAGQHWPNGKIHEMQGWPARHGRVQLFFSVVATSLTRPRTRTFEELTTEIGVPLEMWDCEDHLFVPKANGSSGHPFGLDKFQASVGC
jgi:hypothetical protein